MMGAFRASPVFTALAHVATAMTSQYCTDDEVRVVWDTDLKDRQVVGLVNGDHYCFANATMQCLASTPMVGNLAINSPLPQIVEGQPSKYAKFETFIGKLRPRKGTSNIPVERRFVDEQGIDGEANELGWVDVYKLMKTDKDCKNGAADADEFLQAFLQYLADRELETQLTLKGVLDLGTLRTNRAFNYYQKGSKICTNCHRQTLEQGETYSSNPPLRLDAHKETKKQNISIMDLLTDTLLSKKELSCEACFEPTMYVETRFVFPPNNLILKWEMVNKTVTLEKTLDIQLFVDGSGEHQYELHGIMVFEDGNDHYIAYVQNMDKKWYKTNDRTSTPINWEDIKTRTHSGHLLFYHRTSPNVNAFPQDSPTLPAATWAKQTPEDQRRVGLLRLRQKLQRGEVVSLHTSPLTKKQKTRLGNNLRHLQLVAPR
jgi:hypothetical protein